MNTTKWQWFKVGDIFECSTTKHSIMQDIKYGNIPLVTRSATGNGISMYVDIDKQYISEGNCITIGAEGIVSFYQPTEFATGVKVYTLRNLNMNKYIALFLCTLLDMEKYRYNYGKARILDKIKEEKIKLPVTRDGKPDWNYIESFIKETIIPKLPKKSFDIWNNAFDTNLLINKKYSLDTSK